MLKVKEKDDSTLRVRSPTLTRIPALVNHFCHEGGSIGGRVLSVIPERLYHYSPLRALEYCGVGVVEPKGG
jgi:hypothetical protein